MARALLLLILLAGGAWTAKAVEVPALSGVPASLAEPSRSELKQQRHALSKRLSLLKRGIGSFNRDCVSVVKGSKAASSCRQRQSGLEDELRIYRADAEAFNRQVEAAVDLGQRRAGADTAVVGGLRGEVFVKSASGMVRIGPNYIMRQGDEIRTGKHSRVELMLIDGSRIRLGPESVFQVEELQQRLGFRLTVGKFRAWVRRSMSRRFRVRTPSVAVAVRGTEFAVSEAVAGALVEVFRGEVEAVPVAGGETVLIRAGWRLHLSSGGGSRLEAID